MGYRMSKHASLFHFSPYFLLFGRHPIPPSSIAAQMDQVVNLDSPTTWAKRQPNDTLDTSSSRTILRIKEIRPSAQVWGGDT
ncbi:unnamed protein product [Sphagnum troendelagicum]